MKSSESHRPVPEGIELRGTGESDYPENAREVAKALEDYLGEQRDDIMEVYGLFTPVAEPSPANPIAPAAEFPPAEPIAKE